MVIFGATLTLGGVNSSSGVILMVNDSVPSVSLSSTIVI